MPSLTYKESGVDIEKANSFVKHIKRVAKTTAIPGILTDIGGFCAAFEPSIKQYKNPVLVATTDGVGTKLKIANMLNKHEYIGIDLVAMCVNDLITQGAKPLFFLDYYATAKLDTKIAIKVISSIAKGCQQAGCALIGGETAEMPSMYQTGDYDLAGFCIGIIDKNKIINSSKVGKGDHIIALGSSGVHANGYSLVRKILAQSNPDNEKLNYLIKPTKIYVKPILSLIEKFPIHAISHITGGGLLENIPRVLPFNLAARLNKNSWQLPDIFKWLQKKGNITTKEMYTVFNCGIGMTIILPAKKSKKALQHLDKLGENAWLVGSIIDRDDKKITIE